MLINNDDIAKKYEDIIRKCFECDRYAHGANADEYRRLQDLHEKAMQRTGFDNAEQWKKYNAMAKKIVGNLQKAVDHIGKTELSDDLTFDDETTIGLEALAATIGKISASISQ